MLYTSKFVISQLWWHDVTKEPHYVCRVVTTSDYLTITINNYAHEDYLNLFFIDGECDLYQN